MLFLPFMHGFASQGGMGIGLYTAQKLDDVSLNISEVSYKVGIKDASYFNRCFKQYYGMSPKQYRERG